MSENSLGDLVDGYVTLEEAAQDERVPYTLQWIRRLAQDDKIEAQKVGKGGRATWLINVESLLDYVKRMDLLGTDKHTRQ